jgi:leucyl aminopeptidase
VASGVRAGLSHHPTKINVYAPGFDCQAVALGAALGAYQFDKYFSSPKEHSSLKTIQVLLEKAPTLQEKKAFNLGLRIADGVCLARDLVNEPPNYLTPETLADRAKAIAKRNKLYCKVLDEEGILKAKMNLHAAVGQGSDNKPTFIHLAYKPPRATKKIVLIGKGITFDSGGLCIKPAPNMPEMKTDMAGAAAVLGVMEAIAALKPGVEVHGLVGAAENMPDAGAYRPSDVITSLSGKGVEVINTDAEGRLVLADALTYGARLKPDFMVDAATLTGATLLSLGAPFSAFYTSSSRLRDAMNSAATEAGESFWHMPLIEELAQQLKSRVTDLKHTGERMGGAITAALFLREFTEGIPWMHCDIPGPVFRERAMGMHPQGGTGHAVLTFLKLIEKHEASAAEGTRPVRRRGTPPIATSRRAKRSSRTAS